MPIDGARGHFLDNKTIQYEPSSNTVTFWEKSVLTKSDIEKLENNNFIVVSDNRLTKYKAKLDTLDLYLVHTIYYKDGAVVYDIDATKPTPDYEMKNLSYIERQYSNFFNQKRDGYYIGHEVETFYEHEVKYVCDYLGIHTGLKDGPHNWKFLYEHQMKRPVKTERGEIKILFYDSVNEEYYICTDLYVKNYVDGISKFYVKEETTVRSKRAYRNKHSSGIKNAYIDFKEGKIWLCNNTYIGGANAIKANKRMFKEIVPDSPEEAIYNEALKILSKKQK